MKDASLSHFHGKNPGCAKEVSKIKYFTYFYQLNIYKLAGYWYYYWKLEPSQDTFYI